MDNKKEKSIGYYIGTVLGAILTACAATCVGAIAVGLTVKFIMWIF